MRSASRVDRQGARLGALLGRALRRNPCPCAYTTAQQDRRGPTPHGGQVNKTYQRSLDLAFRAGAKISQICGEGNALFQEDFWTANSQCGDG